MFSPILWIMLLLSFPYLGTLFTHIFYILRKRIPGCSLLHIFILLLCCPWYWLRLQEWWKKLMWWEQITVAFFSDFGWGLITYTCLSCCEVCDDFPRRVITSELPFTNVSSHSSSQWKTRCWFLECGWRRTWHGSSQICWLSEEHQSGHSCSPSWAWKDGRKNYFFDSVFWCTKI